MLFCKKQGPHPAKLPEPLGWRSIYTWPDFTRLGNPDHTNYVPPYDWNPIEFQSFWRGNQLPGSGMTSDRPETYAEILPGYYDPNTTLKGGNYPGGGFTTLETNRWVARVYAAYDKYHEV